jgi:hypothetical protein
VPLSEPRLKGTHPGPTCPQALLARLRGWRGVVGIVNLNWPHCDGRIWPRLKLVEVSDGSAPEDGGGVAVEFGEEYFDSGCGIE